MTDSEGVGAVGPTGAAVQPVVDRPALRGLLHAAEQGGPASVVATARPPLSPRITKLVLNSSCVTRGDRLAWKLQGWRPSWQPVWRLTATPPAHQTSDTIK